LRKRLIYTNFKINLELISCESGLRLLTKKKLKKAEKDLAKISAVFISL